MRKLIETDTRKAEVSFEEMDKIDKKFKDTRDKIDKKFQEIIKK